MRHVSVNLFNPEYSIFQEIIELEIIVSGDLDSTRTYQITVNRQPADSILKRLFNQEIHETAFKQFINPLVEVAIKDPEICQFLFGNVINYESALSFSHHIKRIATEFYSNRGTCYSSVVKGLALIKHADFTKEESPFVRIIDSTFYNGIPRDSPSVPRDLLSESYDSFFDDIDHDLANPISELNYHEYSTLKVMMTNHLEARLHRMESVLIQEVDRGIAYRDLCLERANNFDENRLRKPLNKLKKLLESNKTIKLPRPETKNRGEYGEYFEWLTIEDVKRIKLKLIEELKLYQLNVRIKTIKPRNEKNRKDVSVIPGWFHAHLKMQDQPDDTAGFNNNLLYFLGYHLSSITIYACISLLQVWFGWNYSTARKIRFEDINYGKTDPHKIILTPEKTKTQSEQIGQIDIVKEPEKVRIVDILLWHYQALKKHCDYENTVLSATPAYSNPVQVNSDFSPNKKNLILKYNLPHFTNEQIRDQFLNLENEKFDDITRVFKKAGHKSLATLHHYLDQRINRIVDDINMNEFTKQLEASLIWAFGDIENTSLAIDKSKINKELFFPVGDVNYGLQTTVVDEWIEAYENHKDFKIIITKDRAEWCKYQQEFYEKNWELLNSKNSERFMQFHLKRMIFSNVLGEIIDTKFKDEF